MNKPLISIITPMWKGANLVGETIESVLSQTFNDWEMIIVDDCSPDNNAGVNVVLSYANNDERIKLIQLKKNKGSSGARNEAMKVAQGRYYAFLDSDDVWEYNFLETMMKSINNCNNEKSAIYFCSYKRMDSKLEKELLEPYVYTKELAFDDLLYHCPIFPSTAIIDTSRIKTKVFFREELKNLRDDYVFWLDILSQGLIAIGFKDILVKYRMRDDSLTASKKNMIKPQWNIYRRILHFNIIKSSYYLFSWALNGLKKYKYISNKIK